MIPWIKELFTDKTAFIGGIRSILAVAGLGIESGRVPVPEGFDILGLLAVGAALFIRSSTKGLGNEGKHTAG